MIKLFIICIFLVVSFQSSRGQVMKVHTKSSSTPSSFSLLSIDSITFELQPISGLIAFYPLSGNANDLSVNGNNANIVGATYTSDRFGNPNSALNLNGTSDYLSIADKSIFHLSNGISISIWVLPNSGDQFIMQKGTGIINSRTQDGTGWGLFINPTLNAHVGWAFDLFDTDTMRNPGNHRVSYPISSPIALWTHVVGSFDGSKMQLYINDSLKNTTTESFTMETNSDSIQFGRNYWARTNQIFRYGGKMDDIRIYNRALTADEVTSLFHENGW
jgi:hypothetical protein